MMTFGTHMVAVLLALLLLAGSVAGQAPLPTALRDARTVYLVDETGDRRRLDLLAAEVLALKRFRLVADRSAAETVWTLMKGRAPTSTAVPVAGLWVAVASQEFTLIITTAADPAPLWTTTVPEQMTKRGLVKKLVEPLAKAFRAVP